MDLYIYDPSGVLVNKSVSYDNSYEIVEFTAPATGTYNAQIYAPTFGGLDEYVGIAKTALPSLSGWNYAKVKTITGTTAGAQTNYQMKLTVYKASGTDTPGVVYLGGNVKDDFSDLRFTKSDGVTLLDYWIESYTSGVSAVVWVEVDYIPASPGTVDIYIYYGNPSAAGASSGASTFDFFDDFVGSDGASINTNRWDVLHNGSVYIPDIYQNRARIRGSGVGSLPYIATKTAFNNQYVSEFSWRIDEIGNAGNQLRFRSSKDKAIAPLPYGFTVITAADRSVWELYNITTVLDSYSQSFSAGNQFNMMIIRNGSYVGVYRDGILILNADYISYVTDLHYISIGIYDRTNKISMDDFRVRKYTSPEPMWGT